MIHFFKHVINLYGFEAPTEALVLDFDGVFAFGVNWFVFDEFFNRDFFEAEIVLNSSEADADV